MDDHPYYLRQRPNTFPVSTLSAPIASSNIVHSQLPTVTDLAGEQVQFPTYVISSYWFKLYAQILSTFRRLRSISKD